MSLPDRFIRFFRNYLPSPFTLAVLLTLVVFGLALLLTERKPDMEGPHALQLLDHWQGGLWGLLAFAMQMMLMLVLGHVLALSKPFERLMDRSLVFCTDAPSAALTVTVLTVVMGLFNWGLGLIFGAILARKIGEYAGKNKIAINYSLVGAAGYSGLLVWHGGLSGSAPLLIADSDPAVNKFLHLTGGEPIAAGDTIFSTMNIVVAVTLIVALPLSMYLLAKRLPKEIPSLQSIDRSQQHAKAETPAEKLDFSRGLSLFFGLLLLFLAVYLAFIKPPEVNTRFINPNWINLFLLGLCLVSHPHFRSFLNGVERAIKGSSGIMIQFPLYAGILGIMAGSGLIGVFSEFFKDISNETTFPVFTLFSAGAVNFFVPSGGGQWAVQGGIVLQAATDLGVSHPKAIMALCYGDQLTNMLQPFWALPLLGITGLKARDILPYTFFLMIVALLIFISALLIF